MDTLRALLPRDFTRRQRVAGVVLFFVYLIAAQISIYLFTSPAVIVPTAGLALAVLVLEGIELWPAIFAASLLSIALNGSPSIFMMMLPIAQTLQAVAGAYILKKLDFDPLLRRLRDMFALIGVALSTSIIVPLIGIFTTYLHSFIAPQTITDGLTLGSWWTGHILSLLVIAPLIIRWLAEPRFKRNIFQIAEIIIVFAALIALDVLISWTSIGQFGGISLVYFLLVPLFWLAIRIGPRFTILAMFVTSVITVVGAFYSPFISHTGDLGLRIFQLEIFINIIAVIFYIIAGLQEERTEATKSLRSYIDRLEDALNQLSNQDQAKNDFIAVLAHELRNPLAPVVSALELLRFNGAKTGEDAEAMELMDDRLKTIQRLLDDLLDVSRISRAKLRLKKEPVDLRRLIEHSIHSVERNIKLRQQTLIIDIPSEAMVLDADPVRIEQIISNLLTNASKFTSEGGRIAISAKREGDMALISIADNGIGIDPAMLSRIFDAFLQLETGERKGEGLGIGLSLTQRLVEMHGGTIEAKSEGLNYGSEFIVKLPVIPAYATTPVTEKAKAPARPLPGPTDETKKILVVDDNISAAHGVGKLLERKGYEVLYAYTGTEAKEKVASFSPSTVVLDIGLPDMDGYDLARMLRLGMNFEGRLVALTGYGQDEDKEDAREAGFDHHLTKPVSIADLEAVLTTEDSSL
jgi:signal transduction histidine kinase/CheY-like chemotaxis protein